MALPRRPPALLGLGLIGLGLGGLLLLLIDEQVLPRSRGMGRLGGILLGGGGTTFLVGVFVWVRAAIAGAPERRRTALRRWAIALAVLIPAGAAFATYSLGFYWKQTGHLCAGASQDHDLEQRRRDLAAGEVRLRSPFSWLPELVGFKISHQCAQARADLARIDAGECPYHPLPGVSCRCGAERWPADARCQYAQCPQLSPPRLRCSDDPW